MKSLVMMTTPICKHQLTVFIPIELLLHSSLIQKEEIFTQIFLQQG